MAFKCLFCLTSSSDFQVSPQFHELKHPLVSMLQDIRGIVRSPDEDTLLSINNLIAAETCVTVRLWSQLS